MTCQPHKAPHLFHVHWTVKERAAVMVAFERGYRVMPDGSVRSPRGRELAIVLECVRKFGKRRYYPKFSIRLAGERTRVRVHALVAYQLFGAAIWDEGTVIRHLDDDPENWSPENLALGTRQDNYEDWAANNTEQSDDDVPF